MKEMIYIDGEFIDAKTYAVQLDNRGYQFGDGIHESLRVYNGKCFALVKHLERYRRSMRELYIPITDTDIEMFDLFDEMARESGIDNGIIYFQLTRGTAPRTLRFQPQMMPHLNVIIRDIPVNTEWQENGIQAAITDDLRWARCDINSTNMLANVMAQDAAYKRGYQAAILCKKDTKVVTQAADANLFIVRDGVLWTHPADNNILAGVTRSTIVDALAKRLDLPVLQKPFKQDFMLGAEEMFLTNTYNEIVPVIKVEKTAIGTGEPGEITRQLQKSFKEFVAETISGEYKGIGIR